MKNDILSLILDCNFNELQGSVTLKNLGNDPINIWQTGNMWGDYALSFEAIGKAGTISFVKEQQIYTVNAPIFIALQEGEEQKWEFNLNDGTWDQKGGGIDEASNLKAIYLSLIHI